MTDDVDVPIIDWESLNISLPIGEDGDVNVLITEDELYEMLGLRDEDAKDEAERASEGGVENNVDDFERDIDEDIFLVNDTIANEENIQWDRDDPPMDVGSCYPSMTDFRLALRQHAIVKEFELGVEKADKQRFRGYCTYEGCSWKIVARTQSDNSVKVTVNKEKHKCPSIGRVKTKNVTQAWVADRAVAYLRKNPSMGPKELQNELEGKYPVTISYDTVYAGRKKAFDSLFGSWDDSFDWLYRFKAEIELRSPGSVVEIDTVNDDEGLVHFNRFFCAFKPCIDGFRMGCRQYLSIDSTHLNGTWNGQMCAANSLDGNNWMYPVAFGFFQYESTNNWTWFCTQLRKAIGTGPHLAVHSDACKGLETAIHRVFPYAEHRECHRHMMQNFVKKFQGSSSGNMYPAAKAYTKEKFDEYMNLVYASYPNVKDYLEKHHNMLWARSKFSDHIKCDYINNNMAESWNAWIKDLKDLPICELVDKIRERTMKYFEKRRRIALRLQGKILPSIVLQLNAATRGLGHLRVTKGPDNRAEVSELHNNQAVVRHVVDLDKRECTCREWQIVGKPCPHALAFITTRREAKIEDYVDHAFSVQALRWAYEGGLEPITDKSQWPIVDKGFKLHPPIITKSVGRKRKNRIPSCLEKGKSKRARRVCKLCKEVGHIEKTCPLTGTKKRKRKPRKMAQEEATNVQDTPTLTSNSGDLVETSSSQRIEQFMAPPQPSYRKKLPVRKGLVSNQPSTQP